MEAIAPLFTLRNTWTDIWIDLAAGLLEDFSSECDGVVFIRFDAAARELEVFSIFDANDGNLVIVWIEEDGTHGEAVGVGYGGVFGADDLHGGPGAGIRVRQLRHAGHN